MKFFSNRFCKKKSAIVDKTAVVVPEDIQNLTSAIKDLNNSIQNNNSNHRENTTEFTDIWNILEKWKTLLAFITPIAIALGAITFYVYLRNIEHLLLFPEVLSNITAMISIIAIYFFLIIFLAFLPFYSPYPLAYEIKKIEQGTMFHFGIFCLSILSWLGFGVYQVLTKPLIYPSLTNNIIEVIAVIVSTFFPNIALFLYAKYKLQIKVKKDLLFFSLVFHLSIIYVILIFFELQPNFENNAFQALLLISYAINNFLIIPLYFHENNQNLISPYLTFFLIIALGGMAIASGSNILVNLLHAIGYVQKQTDAQWYAVDNRFIEQHQLRSNALKINNLQCGYMAWNVGNTKIFCPETVEEPKKSLCLTIKGDYLQPLPSGYVPSKCVKDISKQ